MAGLLAGGCAGVPPAQVGQTVGTIAGGLAAPGVGAPVGAAVGLFAGMVLQGQVDRKTEQKERHDLSQRLQLPGRASSDPTAPSLPPGEPTRVWVDEMAQDGRLVAGHFDVRYVP